MVYSGGVTIPHTSWEIIPPIYGFLRQALKLVDTNSIYRGPKHYVENNYIYKNECEGTLDDFHGKESILMDGQKVYELRYNGGSVQ